MMADATYNDELRALLADHLRKLGDSGGRRSGDGGAM
jgi:hypothetical protein